MVGQKLRIRIEGDSLVIVAPGDITTLRAKIRAKSEEQGTWDKSSRAQRQLCRESIAAAR